MKFLFCILLIAACAMIAVGMIRGWPRHELFGGIVLAGCLTLKKDIWRRTTIGDNPHHAPCPRCGRRSRIIYMTPGAKLYATKNRCIIAVKLFDCTLKNLKAIMKSIKYAVECSKCGRVPLRKERP